MFGSDFPFGDPPSELAKVRRMDLNPEVAADVPGGNFLRLPTRIAGVGSGKVQKGAPASTTGRS